MMLGFLDAFVADQPDPMRLRPGGHREALIRHLKTPSYFGGGATITLSDQTQRTTAEPIKSAEKL